MPLFTLALRFPETDDGCRNVRERHRNYLADLRDEGKVVAAGPWDHDHGGLIVYQADDANEAKAMMANDPYVSEGVLAGAELHEWQPVIGGAKTLA
jgi:uncharacterized protein YciI